MVVEDHLDRILGPPGRGYEQSWWPALARVSLLSVQFLERDRVVVLKSEDAALYGTHGAS